jgi:hypothetical protein
VDVSGPVHVDPNYRGSEEQDAGVLVAGAQPNEQCSETKRRYASAADALDREEQGPSAQHVVQRENFALDAVQPHLDAGVRRPAASCENRETK